MSRGQTDTTKTPIRRYNYNIKFYLITLLYGPIAVLVLVGFGIYVEIRGTGNERAYVVLIIVGWAAFTFALLVAAFLKHRPIFVDGTGLWDSLFGRRRQYIRWDEVTEIVRRRYRHPLGDFDRERYMCSGSGKVIRFDTNLTNLRQLLDDINIYAEKYHIELYLSDAGIEARQRIRSEPISRCEKRRRLHDGIKSRLIRL